jgi:hypothetical protein
VRFLNYLAVREAWRVAQVISGDDGTRRFSPIRKPN